MLPARCVDNVRLPLGLDIATFHDVGAMEEVVEAIKDLEDPVKTSSKLLESLGRILCTLRRTVNLSRSSYMVQVILTSQITAMAEMTYIKIVVIVTDF
jgi:hypothetical protein